MDPSASEAIFNHSAAPSPAPGQTASDSSSASPASSESASTAVPSSASSIHAPVPQKKEGVSLAGLETEVTQVLGSLRSFWGGVQKQVAPALEAVRKDIASAGVQAKAELERLQAQAAEARARGEQPDFDFANLAMDGSKGMAVQADAKDPSAPLTAAEKGKGKAVEPTTGPALTETISNQAQSLFSRLQASLPSTTTAPETVTVTNPDGTTTTTTTPSTRSLPTLASFQSTLSSHLSSNPNLSLDIPALRATLTSNFQKLQSDLHLADAEKLAEEYLKKSEGVLKEAGRYIQEAVKVVPPTDGGSGGVSWDGSDVWALPSPASKLGGSMIFSQTDAQVAALTGLSTKSVRAKRKDALLRQLRSDNAVLELDPEAGEGVDDDVKALWAKWTKEELDPQGGINGDEWTAKTWAELGPGGEGVEELKTTRDALVPSKMTKDQFWTRYFFRVHQIEVDEQRRKSLLDASEPAEDELFSWDDDETTEPTSAATKPATDASATTNQSTPTPSISAPTTTTPASVATPSEPAQQTTPTSKSPVPAVREPAAAPVVAQKEGASTGTSPRDSEESYDLVSETSGKAAESRAASAKGDTEAAEKKKDVKKDVEEDSDSDWD